VAVRGHAHDVVNVILDSIASVEDYRNCCSLEALAERLKTTAARLRIILRGPIKSGLLRIAAGANPIVYPTVKLLTAHNPELTLDEASTLVRQTERA
jgi:hypothetical protein